jgi:hypothetical protein
MHYENVGERHDAAIGKAVAGATHRILSRCNCFAEHRDLVGSLTCIPSTASRAMSGTLKKAWQLKVDPGFSFWLRHWSHQDSETAN